MGWGINALSAFMCPGGSWILLFQGVGKKGHMVHSSSLGDEEEGLP